MNIDAYTVKLRIYKVYIMESIAGGQMQGRIPQHNWKEVNVLEKLGFEVDDSEEGDRIDEREESKSDFLQVGKKKDSAGGGMQID